MGNQTDASVDSRTDADASVDSRTDADASVDSRTDADASVDSRTDAGAGSAESRTVDATVHLTGALAARDSWNADRCPIAGALDVLSARSAFIIMREAFYGATRFEEFVRRAQISEPVAAARLRELVQAGLMAREDYREPGQRTRQRYLLTEQGADLLPALVALMRWGDRWLERDSRVELRHADCGGRIAAELRCEHGHRVEWGELDLVARRRRDAGAHRTQAAVLGDRDGLPA